MSVVIVTGQPGSGKTALTVDMIANDPQFKGRPLFVMGIPDLKVPHITCPPVDEWTEYRTSPEDPSLDLAYFTFPENALVVIDEAQRVYRPRPTGTRVPPEVAAFETHRHLGVDFILLTQHPGLIDSNIRKLVGRHEPGQGSRARRPGPLLPWPRRGSGRGRGGFASAHEHQQHQKRESGNVDHACAFPLLACPPTKALARSSIVKSSLAGGVCCAAASTTSS